MKSDNDHGYIRTQVTKLYLTPPDMNQDKITRDNIGEYLLDHQLRMLKKTRLDVVDDENWRFNWTMTKKELEEFEKYSVPLLRKVFKFNNNKAKQTFRWFRATFGVRIKG